MQRQQYKGIDDAMVADLYQRHAPPLFAYLSMHIPSSEDAKDVLVEVFLAALEKEQFEEIGEEGRRAWLWRVTRNKVADYYRITNRRQGVPLDDVAETMFEDDERLPEQLALRQEEYERLRLSIQHLSPLQQQVLQLRFVHELRCTDIAQVLGKREGAVRMMLSRTLNLLRSIYEKH